LNIQELSQDGKLDKSLAKEKLQEVLPRAIRIVKGMAPSSMMKAAVNPLILKQRDKDSPKFHPSFQVNIFQIT
jgi:hypothetical protein